MEILSEGIIFNRIYFIRGQKVMLDKDLTELYEVETRRLNEQVKRNIERFPKDFMFQLNEDEFSNLKSQIATSSWGGARKLPCAFTEYGVLMLSSILNSSKAIQVNIRIMRVFTKLRNILNPEVNLKEEIVEIKKQLSLHHKNINPHCSF
jgi:hypothetical protein